MKTIIILSLCMGFANYGAAETDFNNMLNANDIVKSIPKKARKVPPIVPFGGSDSYTEDCARFKLDRSGGMVSEKVKLRSVETETDCYIVNEPGPNGTSIPIEICDETTGTEWNKTVQLEIMNRDLFPWEKEIFNICLNGPETQIHFTQAAYKYNVKQAEQGGEVFFVISPKEKKVLRPDKNGVQFVNLEYNHGFMAYVLTLKDIWAKEYAGERVMVKGHLYEDKYLWGDSDKGEFKSVLNVAGEYEVLIPADEVKKGYVKWGFERIGKISLNEFVDKGETSRVKK